MRSASAFFLLILLLAEGAAAVTDIPVRWRSRMDSLKSADNLEQWIYAWIDALLEDPPGRYQWPGQARQEVWRLPATSDEQSAWFYLLANDGYYQLQHGNIIRSLQAYEEAYRFFQSYPVIAGDEVLEFVLKPLGNNYTRLGDYERAMFIQEQGYRLASGNGDQRQQAAFLINMASTARTAGKLDQAGDFGHRALKLVSSGTPLQGLLFNTLADIAYRRGDTKAARRYVQAAVDVLDNPRLSGENIPATGWLSSAFLLQGQLERLQQHFEEAEEYLKRALLLLEKNFAGSKQREKAKIWLEIGETQFQDEDYTAALQSFDHSLSLLVPGYDTVAYDADRFYPDNTVLDALTGRARVAVKRGDYQDALDQYRQAMAVSEALRQRFFGWESKQDHQQFSLDIAEEAIAAAFTLYKQTGDDRFALAALGFAEQNKARILSDELRWTLNLGSTSEQDSLVRKEKELMQTAAYYEGERIQAELSGNPRESQRFKRAADEAGYELSLVRPVLYRKYPFLQRPDKHDIVRNLDALPSGVEIWEYFAGNDQWYFFRADAEGVRDFVCLGETAILQTSLHGFLERYFNNGPQEMYNDPEGYFRDALRMYQLLVPARAAANAGAISGIGAVAETVAGKGGETPVADGGGVTDGGIMIIPDGALGKMPFEALVTRPDYSYSVAGWPFLVREALLWRAYSLDIWYQLEQMPSITDRKQGFAGFFLAFDEGGAESIVSLPAVKREMKEVRESVRGMFLQGENASSTAFFKAFGDAATVHLSTHAFLLGEHQVPALQFADRQVYISDIYQHGQAPELVVLSACQSGTGPMAKGEGIISLAREFAAAGTGGVVAGLWNLNDEAAAKLTGAFYRKLLKSGDKAGALHAAKLEWLDNPEIAEIQKLPYHWAALIYSGNNRPLHFADHARKPQLFWTWISIVVLAVAGSGWLIVRRGR